MRKGKVYLVVGGGGGRGKKEGGDGSRFRSVALGWRLLHKDIFSCLLYSLPCLLYSTIPVRTLRNKYVYNALVASDITTIHTEV